MRRIVLLLLSAALLSCVADCGRKGAPEAPGPGDKIIYPHTYPSE